MLDDKVELIVEYLNHLVKLHSGLLTSLCGNRLICSDTLVKEVETGNIKCILKANPHDSNYVVGFLGILNGLLDKKVIFSIEDNDTKKIVKFGTDLREKFYN